MRSLVALHHNAIPTHFGRGVHDRLLEERGLALETGARLMSAHAHTHIHGVGAVGQDPPQLAGRALEATPQLTHQLICVTHT